MKVKSSSLHHPSLRQVTADESFEEKLSRSELYGSSSLAYELLGHFEDLCAVISYLDRHDFHFSPFDLNLVRVGSYRRTFLPLGGHISHEKSDSVFELGKVLKRIARILKLPHLDWVVERALDPNPYKRYKDVDALSDELRFFQAELLGWFALLNHSDSYFEGEHRIKFYLRANQEAQTFVLKAGYSLELNFTDSTLSLSKLSQVEIELKRDVWHEVMVERTLFSVLIYLGGELRLAASLLNASSSYPILCEKDQQGFERSPMQVFVRSNASLKPSLYTVHREHGPGLAELLKLHQMDDPLSEVEAIERGVLPSDQAVEYLRDRFYSTDPVRRYAKALYALTLNILDPDSVYLKLPAPPHWEGSINNQAALAFWTARVDLLKRFYDENPSDQRLLSCLALLQSLDRGVQPPLNIQTETLLGIGQYDQAEKLLESLSEDEAAPYRIWLELSRKNFAEAEASLLKVSRELREDPATPYPFFACCLSKGKWEDLAKQEGIWTLLAKEKAGLLDEQWFENAYPYETLLVSRQRNLFSNPETIPIVSQSFDFQ